MFLKQGLVEVDVDTSCQIEKQILTDEIQDQEFLNFAVENRHELFGYIATGRVNIRRYKEDDPPNNPSGKQDVVWGGVEIIQHKSIDALLQKC